MSETSAVALEQAFAAVQRVEEDNLIVNELGSPRLNFEYLRVLYPSLIEYRSGLFVEEFFDQSVVDDILQHSDEAEPIIAAQKQTNSVGLGPLQNDIPFDPVLARAIGDGIAFAWERWVSERFERRIVTVIDIGELDGSVWFRASL